MFLARPAPFGCPGFGLGEAQVVTLIAFSGLSRTTLKQWASPTDDGIEVRHKSFLARTGLDGDDLSLRSGNFGGFVILIELEFEIGQVQLLGAWAAASNGSLDQLDLFGL